MPREATQEAIERTEADRFRPTLGSGSIATMIHIVHRAGRPERSRVSLGEPPAFFEHDDLRRLREASQWDESRSTGLVALGAPVLDYSSTWVSLALGAGGIASSLFVIRGLWINSAPSRSMKSDD